MAEKILIGLAKLEIGDVAADGGMGTVLAEIGNTVEDSAVLADDAPTETEFNIEESDDAIYVSTKKGKTTFKWGTYNMHANTLVKLFGGTVTGDGTTTPFKWEAPAQYPNIEQSIKATLVEGGTLAIPRAKITSQKSIALGKNKLGQADITATILKPKKAGVAPYSIEDEAI